VRRDDAATTTTAGNIKIYPSLLNTSNGGLPNTLRLFIKPTTIVRIQITKKTTSNGKGSAVKVILKRYFANAQLPARDSRMPVAEARAPRKKYSSAVMRVVRRTIFIP
jgi:hypothetical protein